MTCGTSGAHRVPELLVARPSEGSGTAVALNGLAGALRTLGHSVTFVQPARGGPSVTLTRLVFNLGLPRRAGLNQYDLVVGCDMDGCMFRPAPHQQYIVSLKGVSADEPKWERD